MEPDSLPEAVRLACKRAGPGRLPGASYRPLGGGYAMATAGLVVVPLLGLAAWTILDLSLVTALAVFLRLLGVTAVSGGIAWRIVPEQAPMAGVLAGGLTAVFAAVLGLVGEMIVGGFQPTPPLFVFLLLFFVPALLSGVLAGIGHQQLAYPDSEGGLAFDPPSRDIVVWMTAAAFVGAFLFYYVVVGQSYFATVIVLSATVAVATFVAAWFAWGVVPEIRYRGAVAGLCTILLAYPLVAFAAPVYVLLANLTSIGGDTFFGLADVGFFSTSPAALTINDVLAVSSWTIMPLTAALIVLLPLGVVLGATLDRVRT